MLGGDYKIAMRPEFNLGDSTGTWKSQERSRGVPGVPQGVSGSFYGGSQGRFGGSKRVLGDTWRSEERYRGFQREPGCPRKFQVSRALQWVLGVFQGVSAVFQEVLGAFERVTGGLE